MKKNLDMLRSLHAIEVSNQILERLKTSSSVVTPLQEMILVLLSEIMFNTAILADNSDERRENDYQRYKQDDC